MRIGFNALLISGEAGYRRSGINRYLESLLAALPAALAGDELIVYANRGMRPPGAALAAGWRSAPVPLDVPIVRIGWEHLSLPILTRRDRLDLFHGTVNVLPRALPCPAVVTIHDLAFLRWPEQVPTRRYRYLAREVRAAARRASRILAVSNSTKVDVVELLGVEPARVHVTPLGVDCRFRPAPPDAIARLRERHGCSRPFMLAVSTLEPRKNLPALLRAFSRVVDDVPHDLMLVGPEGWLTGELHDTLRRLGLGERVRLTGFVADHELPVWYSAADLFVFPSLYEGFGLPVVEAMACGAPVVTSNVSSLPEVAGDAALLVDPRDEEAIASAMLRVLTDSAFAADLRQRGLQQARRFTWEQTAAATVAAYREALA
ncbi:MAG TPA: glycosyltransferase family 1 protein [Thermomicrobiales bacterium]